MSANRTLVVEITVVLVVVGVLLLDLNSGSLTSNSTLWPTILLALMGFVALLQFIPTGSNQVADTTSAADVTRDSGGARRRYSMMAIYSVYVLALPYLGFACATLIFVPVAACLLGMPLRLQQVAIALATAVGVYLLFQVAFSVPLPDGLLDIPARWF